MSAAIWWALVNEAGDLVHEVACAPGQHPSEAHDLTGLEAHQIDRPGRWTERLEAGGWAPDLDGTRKHARARLGAMPAFVLTTLEEEVLAEEGPLLHTIASEGGLTSSEALALAKGALDRHRDRALAEAARWMLADDAVASAVSPDAIMSIIKTYEGQQNG